MLLANYIDKDGGGDDDSDCEIVLRHTIVQFWYTKDANIQLVSW